MSGYFSQSIAGKILRFFGGLLEFLFRAAGKILGFILSFICIVFLGIFVFALLNATAIGAALGAVSLVGVSVIVYVLAAIATILLPLILACIIVVRLIMGYKFAMRTVAILAALWVLLGAFTIIITLRNSSQIEIFTNSVTNTPTTVSNY